LITRIIRNGDDVWQLLGLTLQRFHMRMGKLDTTNMIAVDTGASILDEHMIELTKDLVLPTALVKIQILVRLNFYADNES
jgi:hypothetical protein